jgi:hypothetical protein
LKKNKNVFLNSRGVVTLLGANKTELFCDFSLKKGDYFVRKNWQQKAIFAPGKR